MQDERLVDAPIIPIVRQPKGVAYFFGTWSGRLLLVNALVFLWMVTIDPSSFFSPNLEFIKLFGSKSMADIARGEYWRFVTPVFVHIGILHFFFNMMGLYYIGYQIESILGPAWFLALYFMSGIVGNLASCVFSLAPSAGASGALFGLLGAGFRLEGLVNEAFDRAGVSVRPRRKIYSGMVITNIILGIVIPVIDNAAHIGGLLTGTLLMEAMLRLRDNKLRKKRPSVAIGLFGVILAFSTYSVWISARPEPVKNRFIAAGLKANSAPDAYYNFSEAIRIKPLDQNARLMRGKLLLQNREIEAGLADLKVAIDSGANQKQINGVADDLRMTGDDVQADMVLRLLDGASQSLRQEI